MTYRTYSLAAVTALMCCTGPGAFAQVNQATFSLSPNPTFLKCIEKTAGTAPAATVHVVRGKLHDRLTITVTGLKPNLQFDMFTVQRSNLDSHGTPVSGFPGFGLAWYQSDLDADDDGEATTTINTILVDQIFGFDPDSGIALAPTNTFHVGFWFNRPKDAAPCGFNVSTPTPFNGEHKAGPVAMISVPNATTGLGPLCLNPNTSTSPATCHP